MLTNDEDAEEEEEEEEGEEEEGFFDENIMLCIMYIRSMQVYIWDINTLL